MICSALLTLGWLASAGAALPAAEAPEPAFTMAKAANAFLAALDSATRAKASLPFNSEERLNWHFVPRERQGVSIKQMSPEQRQAALSLLKSSLSARGFTKVDTILHLEKVLFAIEGSAVRDPDLYFFTVFGEPSERGAWGWRYEGHHISLNWTVVDGRLAASTPQFLGSNPADVRDGPQKGTRALAAEEDLGRALVKSLSADERAQAVVSQDAPADILSGNSREAAIQEDKGISYAKLTQEQQGLLISLIQEYASTQPAAVAQARLARIKTELPNIKFAWMGGLEKGQGHYYRIQGSTFLIEYDNTQNNANHIHTVWREFKGDWGKDLLAEHYRTAPHHATAAEMLVTSAWLLEHKGDKNLVLLHVGVPAEFEAEHIPGAQLVNPQDLSIPRAEGALILQLLPPDALREKLESLGISDDSRVIVYFAKDWVSPTTRIYFSLDAAGLGDRTSLLDGGMPSWRAAGGPVTAEVQPRPRGKITAAAHPELVAQLDKVKASLGKPGVAIVDARKPQFFDGSDPGSMPRAGRIPGAKSLPFDTLLTDDNLMKSEVKMTDLFKAAGIKPGDTVVSYCHVGQQATVIYFAAKRLGFTALLYDGSWDEWSRKTDLPIEPIPPKP